MSARRRQLKRDEGDEEMNRLLLKGQKQQQNQAGKIKNQKYLALWLVLIAALASSVMVTGITNVSIPSADKEVSFPSRPPVDILVMVMGPERAFRTWLHRLQSIKGKLTFIYASYTDEILITKEELKLDFDYDTLYIPNTTWTEGRTILGAEALRKEKARNKEFDYWLFSDDDVDFSCHEDKKAHLLYGDEKDCWQRVFDFIGMDDIPERASAIVALRDAQNSIAATTTYDAMFNAFKREYVPYLQPYAMLPDGFSQWISQAALFCVTKTCLPGSAVAIPYVTASNNAHREYIRGMNMTELLNVIADNFHDDEFNFHPCTEPFETRQRQDLIQNFHNLTKMNDNMRELDPTQCDVLTRRFDVWQNKSLDKI